MGVRLEDLRCEQTPSQQRYFGGWTIKRAPNSTRPTRVVTVSDSYLGFRTHWWNNRTVPCVRVGCPACKPGQRSDWHGYLLCLWGKEEEHVLFEFTAAGKPALDAIIEQEGNLRGLVVSVSRAKETKSGNGRVIVNLQRRANLECGKVLPLDEPIFPILCGIWGLAIDDGSEPAGLNQTEEQHVRNTKREKAKAAKVAEDLYSPTLFDRVKGFVAGGNGHAVKEGS